MATPTRKRKYEEVRLSLSRSSLAVPCAGVSAFRFPIVGVLSLVAISTTHCTVHMLDMSVRLGSVGTCNVSVSREWDGHGRSVGWSPGRSVDARAPVDHDSVGLTQARPNYADCAMRSKWLPVQPRLQRKLPDRFPPLCSPNSMWWHHGV